MERKLQFISDLHKIFLLELESWNDIEELLYAYMLRNNAPALSKDDIEGSYAWDERDVLEHFFTEMNSTFYNYFQHFCVLCEKYLDLSDIGTVSERAAATIHNFNPLIIQQVRKAS